MSAPEKTVPVTRRIALLAAMASLLAACGKKGDVDPPSDQPSTFPRRYPR